MTSPPTLDRAQDYIWRSARLLERQLFSYLFLGGRRESVLAALAAYQNEDGGFGNALEPDKRWPDSQPIDAEIALRVLDDVGFDDSTVRRLCDYLDTITTPEGGVPFALSSVRGYPRQPWWDASDDPPAAINPTAALAGLLLKHGVRPPWVERASEYCWRVISGSDVGEAHDALCIVTFLEHAPDRARAEREFERVAQRIFSAGLVALDPAATGYVHKPLEWAPTPDSLCRRLFSDEVIAAHLDALAAEQQPDGSWPTTWQTLSPACEAEWRGWITVQALKTLRAYGRLG